MRTIFFLMNGFSSRISGGDTHCFMLIEYLYKHKKFNINICGPEGNKEMRRNRGVRYFTYPGLFLEEKFYGNFPILFFIYCYRIFASLVFLSRVKFEVVVASSHLFHDVIPLFFLRRKKITIVSYIHHILGEQKRHGLSFFTTVFLEKVSFFILISKGAIIFTDSESNKLLLVEKVGFKESNVYVTKNGIDLDFINSVETPTDSSYELCYCGRLHMTKGIYDLVNIVEDVKESYPSIRCAIIGQGVEREKILALIRDKDLVNNIDLLGFLDERKKIETLKASKLFLLPSHEEGWGIVIGEAMACGVPVIVYDLKDIVGIWKNNLRWVRCFDLNEFADSIIELLKDGKSRDSYSKRGLDFAKTIDWNDIMKFEADTIGKSLRN